MEEGFEDIEFSLSDLSAIDLVEYLEEYENVKDECVQLHIGADRVVGGFYQELSKDHQGHNYEDVPNWDSDDLSPDLPGEDFDIAFVGLALDHLGERGLCREGEGSKGVHNQINPKELNSWEGWLSEQKNSNEHRDNYWNVDSDLELQESSDILEDVSSPHHRSNIGFEVIVNQDHICDIFDCWAAGSHGKTDICCF